MNEDYELGFNDALLEVEDWIDKNIGKNTDERLTLFYTGLKDKMKDLEK